MTSARISIRLQQMTAERCGSIPVRTTCILSVILMKTAFTSRFSRSGSFRITRSRMRRRRITMSRASRGHSLCVEPRDIPGAPFNGSMCTPTEMTLKKHGDRYYLSALPIKSTENLVVKSDKLDDFTLTHCTHELGSKTCRISFTVKEGDLTCSLYGLEMKLDKNGLTCGESILPRLKNEPMKVDIITDTNSVEIYLNGVANTVIAHVLDEAKPTFTIHAEDPVEVQNLTVSELSL